MLSFTRKTDYALISLVHIAREKGQCCSAREIASHYGMPMPLLMNILKVLNQHGITRSVRGPRGGYQLAKSPEDITLYEIILAVDGPVALVHCLEKKECGINVTGKDTIVETVHLSRPRGCDLKTVCPVRGQVHRVHHKLVGFLKEVNLKDLTGHGSPRASKVLPVDPALLCESSTLVAPSAGVNPGVPS